MTASLNACPVRPVRRWIQRTSQAGWLMGTFWGRAVTCYRAQKLYTRWKPCLSLLYPGNRGLQYTPFKTGINNRWKREERCSSGNFGIKFQKKSVRTEGKFIIVSLLLAEQTRPVLPHLCSLPTSMHKETLLCPLLASWCCSGTKTAKPIGNIWGSFSFITLGRSRVACVKLFKSSNLFYTPLATITKVADPLGDQSCFSLSLFL